MVCKEVASIAPTREEMAPYDDAVLAKLCQNWHRMADVGIYRDAVVIATALGEECRRRLEAQGQGGEKVRAPRSHPERQARWDSAVTKERAAIKARMAADSPKPKPKVDGEQAPSKADQASSWNVLSLAMRPPVELRP